MIISNKKQLYVVCQVFRDNYKKKLYRGINVRVGRWRSVSNKVKTTFLGKRKVPKK